MTWHLKDRELERKLVELYPSFLDDVTRFRPWSED